MRIVISARWPVPTTSTSRCEDCARSPRVCRCIIEMASRSRATSRRSRRSSTSIIPRWRAIRAMRCGSATSSARRDCSPFALKPWVTREALATMLETLKLFGMGGSWGGYESLVSPFRLKTYRNVAKDRRPLGGPRARRSGKRRGPDRGPRCRIREARLPQINLSPSIRRRHYNACRGQTRIDSSDLARQWQWWCRRDSASCEDQRRSLFEDARRAGA